MRVSAPRPGEAPEPLTRVQQIYLYDEPDALGLDLGQLAGYLAAVLPTCEVHTRRDFLTHHLARFSEEQREALGRQLLAQLRRTHLEPGELPASPDGEALYHAASLQAVLRLLLPADEEHLSHLHFVFTNLRLGRRPAAQDPGRQLMVLLGEPNLFSLSGIIEAPAAAREYEFLRAQMAMFGLEEGMDELEERFAPQMLTEGDPRLGEVLKGLLLQALFYRIWGEAFCEQPRCRLHPASSHEEILTIQASSWAGLCETHREWLREIGGAPERA